MEGAAGFGSKHYEFVFHGSRESDSAELNGASPCSHLFGAEGVEHIAELLNLLISVFIRSNATIGIEFLVFKILNILAHGSEKGVFLAGEMLIDLLEAVSDTAGEMRLRLGSLEPRTITEEFCRRAARLPNLCPHFHLSMQSGCDGTLRRMNRKYDTARFYESVSLLRQYFDRPAVTTDLITGFPGETEEEFAQTLAFIEKCGFAAMHIFPYSVRPGTKAAAMPDQCTAAVKERRAARAAETAERMKQAYLHGCVGQTYPVLFEQEKGGLYVGHAPNYCQVGVRGEDLHNAVRNVKIEAVDGDMLIGELT